MVLFWVLHLGVFRSAQIAPVGILARHYGIYFIREAWQEVTSQTIENSWRKTQIANCSNMSEYIEKIREEREQLIAERLKQFEYTPREYVSVDDRTI